MTGSGFNPPDPTPSIRKTPVRIGEEVELQHEDSKLFLSKFGRWYRAFGQFNREMLPPEVGRVPFPHKLVSVRNEKKDGEPLASGDWVRIRTTQTMPPPGLTMIGSGPGQNWSLCKHEGDELVQFYFTEDESSEWKIHRVAGEGAIHYGDSIRLEKRHPAPSEAGWLKKSGIEQNNEFHADLAHQSEAPSSEANWIIYPGR